MTADPTAAAVFVLVTVFTPGPNNVLAGSLAALHGYRRTLPFMLGVAGGFLVIMVGCLAASSLLAAELPRAAPVLRAVGAAYMLWLAVGVFRAYAALPGADARPVPLGFRNGWLLQFVNPKSILFGLTVYTVFLVPLLEGGAALALSPLLLVAAAFGSVSAWALGGHLVRRWIRTPWRARLVGAVLAGTLVWMAGELLLGGG